MRSLVLATALLAAGCSKRDRQPEVIEEVELLSHDQCLKSRLSEGARKRAVAAAKAKRITMENIDAYVGDIVAQRRKADKSNLGVDSYCQIQVNIWKKHFGR